MSEIIDMEKFQKMSNLEINTDNRYNSLKVQALTVLDI